MVANTSHSVHELMRLTEDEGVMARLMSESPEELAAIERTLTERQIEVFERPSANPGEYGHPGASPKQIDFQRAFFAQRHRIYAASGANQSGKTQAVAGLCFAKWLRDEARDGDAYWVIADTHETMRDIPHKSLWQFLPRSMFPEGIEYKPKLGFGMIPTLHLTLPEGRGKCEVWFKTQESDLNVFESSRLNGVWWTECTREALFDALQPRLAAKGGWLLMDYVPREAWHRMRIQAPASSGSPFVYHMRFAMLDNAHNLNPGEIEYQRSIMTEDEAAVRIDGEDGSAFGVVFKEFSAKAFDDGGNVVEPFTPPEDWPCWVFIDVGKYTAAEMYMVGPDGRKRAVDEVYTLGANVSENADQIKSMVIRCGRKVEDVQAFKMDPAAWAYTAANRATIAEQYAEHGIICEPWTRTQTVGESAMLDHARIECQERRFLVAKRCENLIREMQTWRHKTDKDGKVDPREAYTGDNHAIDTAKAWLWEDCTYDQPALEVLDTAGW